MRVDVYARVQGKRSRTREGKREREGEKKSEMEDALWGMMAKLLRAVSQLGWLARCVSVRFVRRLTAWSRRDKARPTLPLGFCSGLISYPPAPPGHPRTATPFEVYFAIVTRTPRVLTGCGLRPGARPRRTSVFLLPEDPEDLRKTEGLILDTDRRISQRLLRNLMTRY